MRRLFRITGSRKAPVHHQDGSFFACGKISGLEEHVLEDKQHGQHIHQGADLLFLGLAGDQIDQGPGDHADGDALGNAVSGGRGQNGQEGGDALAGVIEVDLDGGTHHVEAHDDQGRSRCKGRDGEEQRAEDGGQQEQDAGGHSGQTGAAALGNAGSTLDEGGGGGSAQHSACAGGDGVGHQCALDVGQLAVLVQHVGLGCHADQGAQGVKQVHEQEGEHDGKEVQEVKVGEIRLEHLTKGLAQGREVKADKSGGDHAVHARIRIGHIDAGDLAEDAQHPGDQDAVQDAALDLLDQQDAGDGHADEGQDGTHAHAVEGLAFEVLVGDQRRVAVHDQLGVLQADKGHERADAHADRALQGHGDGVEDALTHIGQGQRDEDDALHKHGHQGQLPAVAHGHLDENTDADDSDDNDKDSKKSKKDSKKSSKDADEDVDEDTDSEDSMDSDDTEESENPFIQYFENQGFFR